LRLSVWLITLLMVLATSCGGNGTFVTTTGPGGGPDTTDSGGGTTTPNATPSDPNAVVIYVANGFSVSAVEVATDETVELASDLDGAFTVFVVGDDVFVAELDGTLLQVDPGGGGVVGQVDLIAPAVELALEGQDLWALSGSTGIQTQIEKVDLSGGQVTATVTPAAGSYFDDLAAGGGSLWAVGGDPKLAAAIAKIDPALATVTATYDVGIIAGRLAVEGGAVWVVGGGFVNPDGTGGGDVLVKVDPATGEVVATTQIADIEGFPDIAAGYGAIWITDTAAGELVRVDPATGTVAARIPVGSGGQDRFEIDLAKGLVWVTNPFDDKSFAVDPALNAWEQGVDRIPRFAGFAP